MMQAAAIEKSEGPQEKSGLSFPMPVLEAQEHPPGTATLLTAELTWRDRFLNPWLMFTNKKT